MKAILRSYKNTDTDLFIVLIPIEIFHVIVYLIVNLGKVHIHTRAHTRAHTYNCVNTYVRMYCYSLATEVNLKFKFNNYCSIYDIEYELI